MAHTHSSQHHGKAFAIGIALNIIYVMVELFYGLRIHSTALTADAGHNASDVLSLALAWVAISIAGKKPSLKFTYGLRKSTVMASLINGVLIIVAAALIAWDAIDKFSHPVETPGNIIMIVAAVGLVVNTGTAFLFYKDQGSDLNIKGAFLHMAADAVVTLGVLLGGLAIRYTGVTWIDPVLGLLIVLVIVYSSWGLLRDSVRLALDAAPSSLNIEEVQRYLEQLNGVKEVHDLHVWAISTTETAMTAHLVMPNGGDDSFLFRTREQLHEKFQIVHTTLQIEQGFEDKEYRDDKI